MKATRNDLSWWEILLILVVMVAFAGFCEYVAILFKVKVLRSLGVGI